MSKVAKKQVAKKYISKKDMKTSKPPTVMISQDDINVPLHASPSHQYDPTINIAVIGAVSAGKSTFTNALFVEQYSDMNIKRTTTMPQVYIETNKATLSEEEVANIREYNRDINNTYMDATADGKILTADNIHEIYYAVPKMQDLFTSIPDGTYVAVYDLPGLNDSMTKDVYHSYVKNNFYKFDVVIFIVDVNSALNTSDEIDILNLIMDGIKTNDTEHGIKTQMILLINKCDDLEKNEDDDMIPQEEEYKVMYDQIQTILSTKLREHELNADVHSTCMSCEDGYIYRMYKRNPDTLMDIKYLNKFGANEYGKKIWNKYSEKEKKVKVSNIFKTFDYTERMEQCGFAKFNEILGEVLDSDNQYTFLMNHIRFALDTIVTKIYLEQIPNIGKALSYIKKYEKDIYKIQKRYELKRNNTLIQEFSNKILSSYVTGFVRYISASFVISCAEDTEMCITLKSVLKKFVDLFGEHCVAQNSIKLLSDSLDCHYIEAINYSHATLDTIIDNLTKLKNNNNGWDIIKHELFSRFNNFEDLVRTSFLTFFGLNRDNDGIDEEYDTDYYSRSLQSVITFEEHIVTAIENIADVYALPFSQTLVYIYKTINEIYSHIQQFVQFFEMILIYGIPLGG